MTSNWILKKLLSILTLCFSVQSHQMCVVTAMYKSRVTGDYSEMLEAPPQQSVAAGSVREQRAPGVTGTVLCSVNPENESQQV